MKLSDPPVFTKDLMQALGINNRGTLYRQIKIGRIPQPDVVITQKTRYWFRSTLEKAGLIRPESSSAATPS